MERFEAKQKGNNGSWGIYDNERKCYVLQSVSPNATYNKEYSQKVAYLMNVVGATLDFSKP